MIRFSAFALLLAGLVPSAATPALAQSAAGETIRLSPAEREAAIEAGATLAASDLPLNGVARGIHGEMGVEVGSNGGRAAYGTAVVPLGETGSAAFSFLTGTSGRWRAR